MARIKIGDIFEIETPKGKGYLHYIYKDESLGELIRVLPNLYNTTPESIDEIVVSQERFLVYFPLSFVYRKKLVKKIGSYSSNNFSKPEFMREKYNVRGEFLGWYIINTDNWERTLVKKLDDSQKKLSPWGVWTYELLVENIANNWSLEYW